MKQLAQKAGTSDSTICDIENGNHSPSLNTLEWIIRALGYDIDWVIKEAEDD